MKRLFATLGLIQLFLVFSTVPVANAADSMSLGICNLEFTESQAAVETGADLKEELELYKKGHEDDYNEAYTPDESKCGEVNDSTGLIEKGDCNGQVITEITEIVSDATPDVASESGDKIVNVYQGICCIDYDEALTTCYETRTYYTADFETCQDTSNGTGGATTPNCQLRQWLIASTGMGLLKLYVKQIFTFGAFAVGAIAVAIIILNGIRISVTGVSGDISDAKQKITQSLSGIVLLFLSALILYSINPDFFGG